ncbi:TonB-dependent receptor [Asticcacaulis sp. SL142]|uniref:TonB-dependent receptor n=1 Tax=Asticcacaulis sp. SL142 TaxID=2995155 RepID=UPI00226D2464|nr:TonB-dependent receptor [Asticcacaulis sp. SL142]WAC47870.1 TonB-dependent receptor [Asticcacaulis sp. SL142]
MTGSSFKIALSAGISLIALSGVAQAQSQVQAQNADEPVKEVVVTGSAYAVSKDALMSNVDVLKQAQIDEMPARGLGDMLSDLPGVRSSGFAPGASRPIIRGLDGFRVLVLNNGMGQVDASAVSPDHASATDPLEAQRIEVLRGPSALTYGGNAIGGIVNIIDDRIAGAPAKDGLDGRVTAQASSVDEGYQGAFNLKAGNGPWVLTLDGLKRKTEDYKTPVGPESRRLTDAEGEEPDTGDTQVNSATDLESYGAGLSYVGDFGFIGFSAKQTNSLYGVPGHSHEHEEGEAEEGHEEEGPVRIDLKQTRYDFRSHLNIDSGPFNSLQFAAGYTDYEHTELEGDEVGTRFLSDGKEFRANLIRQGMGEVSGVIGINGLTRDFEAIGAEAFVPSSTTKELGVFSQGRLDKGNWGVEGGLRLDQKKISSAGFDRDFTNTSASLGAFYKPSDHSFFGASLTRSERAPSDVELLANGPHAGTGSYEIGNADFDTEVGYSLELTGHWLMDEHSDFTFDAHVYTSKFDNFIDLRPTGAEQDALPVYQYVQTDADFYGLELEGGINLWARGDKTVRFDATYDYVHGDSDLGPVARIPPYSVTGKVSYTDPRWTTHIEARYAGEQDRLTEQELPTDSYTLVNLFAAYKVARFEGVSVFAEVRNVFDEEAREHASFNKDILVQPGRNLRAGLSYRF